MSEIRHARWFEENAERQSSIKVLIRIITDMRNRFEGFKGLSPWTIEVLTHYCVMFTEERSALPLGHAFKRFFMMISSGILLPNSNCIIDPCDPRRINDGMTMEEMVGLKGRFRGSRKNLGVFMD